MRRCSSAENLSHLHQGLGQAVDIGRAGIEAEGGTDGAGEAEMVHQRLGAMEAGADTDPLAPQERAGVMRVDTLQVEGEDADPLPGLADQAEAGDLAEARRCVSEELLV